MNSEHQHIENHIRHLICHCPHIKRLEGSRFLYDSQADPEAIPILSGGGSGHEPAHFGYIGRGMLTGALAGEVFVPPTAEEILTAIRFLNRGKGVFLIIKNFEADIRRFNQAMALAKAEGIAVSSIISHDDISVDTAFFKRRHRGVAGTLFLHKILGQAALKGASLEELETLGLALSSAIATLGVATKPPTSLLTGKDLFELPPGFISYGVGIHGEAGYKTVPYSSSEKLAIELVNKLRMFFRWQPGETYAILINNLGQTSPADQKRFEGQVLELLELDGIQVSFQTSGRFMTNLNMAGLSLSMCRLEQEDWHNLLVAPTTAPAWLEAGDSWMTGQAI